MIRLTTLSALLTAVPPVLRRFESFGRLESSMNLLWNFREGREILFRFEVDKAIQRRTGLADSKQDSLTEFFPARSNSKVRSKLQHR